MREPRFRGCDQSRWNFCALPACEFADDLRRRRIGELVGMWEVERGWKQRLRPHVGRPNGLHDGEIENGGIRTLRAVDVSDGRVGCAEVDADEVIAHWS